MRARAALAVTCLVLSLTVAGCSILGGPVATSSVATNTVEPTRTVTATEPPAATETTIVSDGSRDVVTTIKASDPITMTAGLLEAAGMAKPISGKDAHTLFVPTNDAYAKLPADWLPKLKDPANVEKLRRLLRYGLVKDRIPSEQMFTIGRMMTYEGGVLTISRKDGAGWVNGKVRIMQTDVKASNGVIHIVDTVLVPPGFTP